MSDVTVIECSGKRETVFTEMCKAVVELAVKTRTQNCFCVPAGQQPCTRTLKSSDSEGTLSVLLGNPENQATATCVQEWAQQTLEDPPDPALGLFSSSPKPKSLFVCSFHFVKIETGEAAKYFL